MAAGHSGGGDCDMLPQISSKHERKKGMETKLNNILRNSHFLFFVFHFSIEICGMCWLFGLFQLKMHRGVQTGRLVLPPECKIISSHTPIFKFNTPTELIVIGFIDPLRTVFYSLIPPIPALHIIFQSVTSLHLQLEQVCTQTVLRSLK